MSEVAEVETQTAWQPGTFVTWGEGLADDPRRSYGVIEGVARGPAQSDDEFYFRVRRDDDTIVDLDRAEVVPGYRKGLDVIPDVSGKLVRVGDWVEYENIDGVTVPVIVTDVKPQEERQHGKWAANTGILDLYFSSVSVKGYGSGLTGFWNVAQMNFRGDWSGGRSRDPHASGRYTGSGKPVLRKLDMSEAEVLRREIAADYYEIEALKQAQTKLDTRLAQTQDKLEERKQRLARVTGAALAQMSHPE